MKMEVKRNVNGEMNRVGGLCGGSGAMGGGSAGLGVPQVQGGEYLRNCTPANGKNKISAIRNCGISLAWVKIAEIIGCDAMIDLWQFLDSNPDIMDGRRRLSVPCYSTIEKYERNLLIHQLSKQHKPAKIKSILNRKGFKISLSQIYAVLSPDTSRPRSL